MSTFLVDTPPSFYDLAGFWHCTLGKTELEERAWLITKYCQQHGDVWQPVPVEYVARGGHRYKDGDTVEMAEWWLSLLQRVRVRLPGPPNLVRNDKAKGGLQLSYPHGELKAATFSFSEEEMARLREAIR